jgi:hypothetical protein
VMPNDKEMGTAQSIGAKTADAVAGVTIGRRAE